MKFFAFRYDKNYDLKPSLLSMVDEKYDFKDKDKFIVYLKNNVNGLAGYMGEFTCLMDPDHIAYSESYNTDGVWVWTTQMIHYIECHHLVIPEDFRAHIEKNNFIMPVLTEEKLEAIVEKLPYLFTIGIHWTPPNGYDESL